MKRRLIPTVVVIGALALAMLPADAAGVTPTFVGGNSNCSSVGSTADFSFTIVEPAAAATYALPGVPGATIELTNVRRKLFNFVSHGATVLDVIVKGSGSNWFHYAPSVEADTDLSIPNGNKLNVVHFCYEAVPTFSISGTKYNDADVSGTLDIGESGLPGWEIELKQGATLEDSATTGTGGAYTFTGVEAGEYQVCEVAQEGWVQTAPDGCHTVTVGPNATGINFLNAGGVAIECDVETEVSNDDGSVTGSFIRTGEDCDTVKLVEVDVTETNEVVFIPQGSGNASYTGVLTFEKEADNPSALVLQYDPDDLGPDPFKDVPDCEGTEASPALPEGGDTWCVISGSAEYLGESVWNITWDVYGEGDPRFR
jgi:hypothetical protein